MKMDYHTDWYDGPLSGACTHAEKRYWFELYSEEYTQTDRNRQYVLYEPTPNQIREHDYWHGEFVKYVEHSPQAEWPNFYDRYKKVNFPPFIPEQARFRMLDG